MLTFVSLFSQISVVVEFVAGKITDSIVSSAFSSSSSFARFFSLTLRRLMPSQMRLIALYRPDSLIVGTKGSRGKLAAWGAVLGGPSRPFLLPLSLEPRLSWWKASARDYLLPFSSYFATKLTLPLLLSPSPRHGIRLSILHLAFVRPRRRRSS